jgi:hypothetical protein
MRSGSDAKGISPSPAQPLLMFAKLLEFAKLLFEKVMTTMNTLMKVPRFAPLKKLALRPGQAARGHLNHEEMAAFVSHCLSRAARKRALNHCAACEDCRRMVAEIEKSKLVVKDVDEVST